MSTLLVEVLTRKHRSLLKQFQNQEPSLVHYLQRFALRHAEKDLLARGSGHQTAHPSFQLRRYFPMTNFRATNLHNLHTRHQRLDTLLQAMQAQYDLETRVEERSSASRLESPRKSANATLLKGRSARWKPNSHTPKPPAAP